MDQEQLAAVIKDCEACATTCLQCAAACLKEESVSQMTRCIQLDLDCAAICRLAAEVLARGSENAEDICSLCADICEQCADECAGHDMAHCQQCALACERCAEACQSVGAPG